MEEVKSNLDMDRITKKQRSWNMSRIRCSANISTELRLIAIFKTEKITGWRRKYPVFGRPDMVFPGQKVAVFADGCFWHGHKCAKIPCSNVRFWTDKISQNRKRDKLVSNTLKNNGWRVVRFWECELKKNRFTRKLKYLVRHLDLS